MYIRPVHAELHIPTLHAFIRDNPLGQFTTSIAHPKYAKLQTTHAPFIIDAIDGPTGDDGEEQDKGVLRAHIARANPHSKAIIDSLSESGQDTLQEEVLVLFTSNTHSYITPKYYVESKPKDGKVVPTWDYAAVQVYGKARIYHRSADPLTGTFLQKQVEELSEQNERRNLDKQGKTGERTWKVSDAPSKYVDLLKKAIVGIEIKIDRIEGRFKLSQESGDGDWQGVVNGFKSLGTEQGNAMAQLVENRGENREVRQGAKQ
ncbi:transcriptional regulator [Kwoniella heveanensis CBS 569]|nr:transcriptional regulator [Kwoniella heveanensis CBS 569]